MGLDIRLPIGMLFSLIGVTLVVYGALADPAVYARSLGLNVNLTWGFVLLLFGAVMLYLGRRGTSAARPAELDPEGREIEELEHRTGLERERGH
jgi:hypothetical protein